MVNLLVVEEAEEDPPCLHSVKSVQERAREEMHQKAAVIPLFAHRKKTAQLRLVDLAE